MMRMKVVGKRKRVMMKMSEFEKPFHILFCKDHVFMFSAKSISLSSTVVVGMSMS